jgi:hypothetical protein
LFKKVEDLELQIDTNHVSRLRKASKRIEDFIAHDVALSGHDSNDLKAELKRVYFGAIDSLSQIHRISLDVQHGVRLESDFIRPYIIILNLFAENFQKLGN